jgi:hypothetical protein
VTLSLNGQTLDNPFQTSPDTGGGDGADKIPFVGSDRDTGARVPDDREGRLFLHSIAKLRRCLQNHTKAGWGEFKVGRRTPVLMRALVVEGSRVGVVLVKILGGASLAAGEVPITHIVVS